MTIRDIPIFQKNRFPGGLIVPGQKVAGQHFIRMDQNVLNYILRFRYSDNRKTYDHGDYLAGSTIPIFYETIPG